jgi:membrane protein
MPAWVIPLRETVSKWSEHKDARLGAALAYYSVFSLGPLILIAVAIAGLVLGAEAVQGQVLGTLKGIARRCRHPGHRSHAQGGRPPA